jgi:drug/metabolite transporter (DMT)-like permease
MVAIAACCFGSIPLFAVLATREGASLTALLAWRYLLAITSFILIGIGTITAARNRERAWPLLILGIGQAAIAFLSLSALRYISAATLSFLFYTYPAWVALIGAVRRTEPLTRVRLAALGLSLAGIAVMVGSPWAEPAPIAGVLLALGSAVMYAIYIPTIGRLQAGVHPLAASTYVSIGAALTFLVVVTAGGQSADLALPGPMSWVGALGLALVSTTVGFLLFLRGLPVLGSVRTAIICTVEPFYTAVAGALMLGQPLTGPTLVGGALIGAAVMVLQRRSKP